MVGDSVQLSTKNQYKTHFIVWEQFLIQYQGDDDVVLRGDLQGIEDEERVQILLSFLAFLYVEKNLEKTTIANYVSGIKYHIQLAGGRTGFFEEIVIKRFNRSAALKDAEIGRTREKKRPIPLTLIMYMLTELLDQTKMQDAPYRIAILVAYFFLLRQSEYIYQSRAGAHAIHASDVEFRLSDGSFVPSDKVQHLSYAEVDLVKVTLRHCKNDPFRQGNSFWCGKQESTSSIDLVREMFTFAQRARSLGSDVFTSIRTFSEPPVIRVTYKRMMELLSQVAVDHRLSPNIFGTHSFRISGATTLNAGSVDTDTIQKMGGWKSKPTSLEYAQASSGSFAVAHKVLLNPRHFTLRDLHLQIQTIQTHADTGHGRQSSKKTK
jgi:hypothetical protein